MSAENTRNPALIAILSILGILAVAFAAGLLLFQEDGRSGVLTGPALSSRQPASPADEFDPISWAREDAAYPPLAESDESDDGAFVADYTGENAIPGDDKKPAEPVAAVQPASVAAPPAPPAEPVYREVRENAYWVQVFSSGSVGSAEAIRDELAAKGLPATVQTKQVDGETWYRVRIGAFDGESEAEHYAENVREIAGFESSYVVIAPVTRRVPIDG